MAGLFEGRVAIITGSGQGIGKDLAKYMASEGCKVVTNNRKKGSSLQAHDGKVVKFTAQEEANIRKVIGDAASVAAEIIEAGGEAIPVYGSVCSKEDCRKLVDAAIEKWGRIDIIINNAASTWTGNIKDMTLDEWDVNIESKLNAVKEIPASSQSIEDAEIVVCAGLGVGAKEVFDQANALAAAIGGTLGHTRPVVDMGYIDTEEYMIGTSGKLVHPKLYLGFGVSGATHHICGMKDSKTVISINQDPDAEIFKVSDYKYVADAKKTVQELNSLFSRE